MFALEVSFLTGRYVATAFDDRGRAEWPPHPARLFSALSAAHFEALDPSAAEREALEWLEQQEPPQIEASEASARDVPTVFVPVNDPSVVGSFATELVAIDEARGALERAEGKARSAAEKKLAKLEARLTENVKRAIAAPAAGKEGKGPPLVAASLLPDRRERQPRTFPSVTPDVPKVVFGWPGADATVERASTLDRIASRVVRLGHSSSLVSMRVVDRDVDATWAPDDTGEVRGAAETRTLRVTSAGQLRALDDVFASQADAAGRVLPAAFERYVRPLHEQRRDDIRGVFGDDWLVLRCAGGLRFPSIRAVDVARMMRKAILSSFGPDAPEILSGHGAPGEASARPHLAYVPLPFVGHRRADGTILGVAVVIPREASREERAAVAHAVGRWRDNADKSDGDAVRLHFGRVGDLLLTLDDEEGPSAATLDPRRWCALSRAWATVTPIALDRNPGDLRSKDPAKEAEAYAAAEETIALACTHIGLPRPAKVVVLPAAPVAGSDKARQFPPFVAGKASVQRVLVHALLTFERRIKGPVLLGAGRFLGLGLCLPLDDRHE